MNSDIERIINQEKEFLSKAESVFITSEWAKNEMISAYNLNESLVFNIGIAGNLEEKFTIPVFKTVKLLFIANNFKMKGGEDLLQAFLVIQSRYPNTELNIIGAKPTHSIKGINNLNYHGFLDKTNPKQLELYILLLSESDLLITPTKSDAAPLTIIEAGYVGTPSIAPKRFAIPELVKECISGYLLPEKFIIDDIVSAIEKYILLSNHKKINLRKLHKVILL
jgi:glycosyltransferase involved in cell wall biosynthesis